MVEGNGIFSTGDYLTPLKDPNQNPWYILMTLHGEQTGETIDRELHERNRKLWNAWACQGMTVKERHTVADTIKIDFEETAWNDVVADEVAALFQKEWGQRNGVDSIVPNIPLPSEFVWMAKLCFRRKVIATRMVFGVSIFSGSCFKLGVEFVETYFSELAQFNHVTFCKEANYQHANFNADLIVLGAKFYCPANFMNTKMTRYANFDGTAFSETAVFSYAEFVGITSFNKVSFLTACSFRRCKFLDLTYFLKTRFGGPEVMSDHSIDFTEAVFDGPTSFEECYFASRLPDMTGATLHETTTITADFAHWPILRPSWLTRLDIWLRLRKKVNYSKQSPKEIKASSARLRHAMAKQMLPEEEHFFFRREMWAAARSGKILPRMPILSFEFLSDYGYSISRPIGWLLCLWLIGIFVYVGRTTMGWWDAAAYSFAAMFKFFGFQRTYLAKETLGLADFPWMETFAATQTVLGFILLFFLGLGLRTRFRLR